MPRRTPQGEVPSPPVRAVVERPEPARAPRVHMSASGARTSPPSRGANRNMPTAHREARRRRHAQHPVLRVVELPIAPRLHRPQKAKATKLQAQRGMTTCEVETYVARESWEQISWESLCWFPTVAMLTSREPGRPGRVDGLELAGVRVGHLEAADAVVLHEHGEEARVRVHLHAGRPHGLRTRVPVHPELAWSVTERRRALLAHAEARGQLRRNVKG